MATAGLINVINTSRGQYIIQQDNIIENKDLILVTGAGGFVGSKVVETLLEFGFTKLRCFIRSNRNLSKLEQLATDANAEVEFVQGNLLSREDCLQATKDVSVIYHLAAGVGKSFPECFLNSAIVTRNLLDAAIQNATLKRFVNIGSIAVYSNGKIPRRGLLDETCEVDTRLVERNEAYTYAKAKQDEIVQKYSKKYHLPHVLVRLGVVFGPGKFKITDRIVSDRLGIYLHLGLDNQIPLTYVDNCAEAIALAGLRPAIDGQVFIITDDNLPTSRQFLHQYKKQVKRITSIPVPYSLWYCFSALWEKYSKWSEGQLPPAFSRAKCRIYWKGNTYSNKKAKDLLGWQPRVPMNDALDAFFIYMKEMQGKQ